MQQLELAGTHRQHDEIRNETPVVELQGQAIATAVAVMAQAMMTVLRPYTPKEAIDDR